MAWLQKQGAKVYISGHKTQARVETAEALSFDGGQCMALPQIFRLSLHHRYPVFLTASYRMHFWLTLPMHPLMALIVLIVGVLDNSFRGGVSVMSEPPKLVCQQLAQTPAYR